MTAIEQSVSRYESFFLRRSIFSTGHFVLQHCQGTALVLIRSIAYSPGESRILHLVQMNNITTSFSLSISSSTIGLKPISIFPNWLKGSLFQATSKHTMQRWLVVANRDTSSCKR